MYTYKIRLHIRASNIVQRGAERVAKTPYKYRHKHVYTYIILFNVQRFYFLKKCLIVFKFLLFPVNIQYDINLRVSIYYSCVCVRGRILLHVVPTVLIFDF